MRSSLLNQLRSCRGQASLEVLVVFGAWFLMIVLFLNIIFLFATLMIAQSSVNRVALQTAAAGCLGQELADNLEERVNLGLGATNIDVEAATTQQRPGQVADPRPWGNEPGEKPRSYYIDEEGMPRIGETMYDITCDVNDENARTVENGHVIYVAVKYDQQFLIFGEKTVVRSVTLISQQREGVL